VLVAGESARHAGGGFNPPEPTTKGGPDYGRFIDAVRVLQDHARAVDAPDEVISEAADLLGKVSELLAPFDTDEWSSPSGRRMDLPMRGNILSVPTKLEKVPLDGTAGRVRGWARFARFHLGRNGAVHGGALGLLFDSVLGMTSAVLTGGRTSAPPTCTSITAVSCRSRRSCRSTRESTRSTAGRSSCRAG
jgi:hypothetical protein